MAHKNTDDYNKLKGALLKKNLHVKELKKELVNTKEKLNELNRSLEKKVIERTVEVNRLLLHKTKFIDNLSHDLGTPLTPLMAILPVIENDVNDPKLKEMLQTCIRNVNYLKNLVVHSQKLAELSSPTTEFYLQKTTLLDVVNKLQVKYDPIFRSSNITMDNQIMDSIYVMTEELWLLELLDHLSSNAVKSMPDGGVISFKAKKVELKTGSFVTIAVQDTGIGLSDDEARRLFDEFYKVDESRHELGSTGLGLSICKRIVEKHNGSIRAESQGKGKGATIYFTLPAGRITLILVYNTH